MKALSILIVDDEKRVRSSLRYLISMYFPGANIVGEAGDIESAYLEIKLHKPDLVLLDIQMPDGNGFDLIKKFMPVDFKVVFITAYNQYAIQAFKYSALDYLLKPVNPEELIKVLEKATAKKNESFLMEKMESLVENMNNVNQKKIVLNTQEFVHIVKLSDIIQIEADRNYTTFYLVNNKTILISKSLIEFEEILSTSNFFRVHHSNLINLYHVLKIDKQNMQVIMSDNSKITIASRKKEQLFSLFDKTRIG